MIDTPQPIPEESSASARAPGVAIPFFSRFFDHSITLFAAFLLIASVALIVSLLTVHQRQPVEFLDKLGSTRSHTVLSHWLDEGYFHYVGMLNRTADAGNVYTSSTGGYMVSGFIVEKVYKTIFGHYSYRLLALHNQFVSMVLSALAGLLAFRLARRFDLEPLLAFVAAAAMVIVLFTFPDNLDLYWEMSAQAYSLFFALVYLIIEERSIDRAPRPRALQLAQAATVLLMTLMEGVFALGFVASLAAAIVILRRDGSWRRFLLVAALPCIAAIGLYQLQLRTATARFPNAHNTGSKLLWRTGLDGESKYYGDHLSIANGRDQVRKIWAGNRKYLLDWKWTFILGLASTLAVLIAFVRGRVPWIALETLVGLIGAWLLYAAIFSQAVAIHPYLYDVLLFTPLSMALFVIAPSLLELLTRRTGTILLVVAFSAIWYSFVQLRLYSLRWPLLPASINSSATKK